MKRAEEYLIFPRRPLKVRDPLLMRPVPLPALPPERAVPYWPDRLAKDWRRGERRKEGNEISIMAFQW